MFGHTGARWIHHTATGSDRTTDLQVRDAKPHPSFRRTAFGVYLVEDYLYERSYSNDGGIPGGAVLAAFASIFISVAR